VLKGSCVPVREPLKLSDDDWKAIRDVAKALGYFARESMFNYIDRIGDAYSGEIAVAALRDALRALQSARNQGLPVYLPSPSSVEHVIKLLEENTRVGYIISALALAYGGVEVKKKVEGESQ